MKNTLGSRGNFLDSVINGSPEQVKKKKILVYAFIATAVALIISLSVFLITGMLSLKGEQSNAGVTNDQNSGASKNDISSYVETTFTEEQKNNGSLLLVDGSHPFKGSVNPVLIKVYRDLRPSTDEGKPIYSMTNMYTFGGTADAVSALDAMLGDFYNTKKNDSLFIEKAYMDGGNNSGIYASGLCFELTYVTIDDQGKGSRHSIYNVEDYSWLYSNAYKYGFIQLYPVSSAAGEEADTSMANIFRYVGEAHAAHIYKNNLTLESYIELIKTKPAADALSITAASGAKYKVYYVGDGAAPIVPSTYEYTVSGDNMGGYIVTVNTSKKISAE